MSRNTSHKKRQTPRRGASLLALCLSLLLMAGLFTACAFGGGEDGGSGSGSVEEPVPLPEEPEGDAIEGIPLKTWQKSTLISERDDEPHQVKIRFTKIDTDQEKVKEQIDDYNVSASGHTIPDLDDPQYMYIIAHYEVAFPDDYPDGDYGITQVVPAFTITAADGGDVFRVGNVNYSGLTETFEIGYQPRGYDFHAGDTYEGAIVFVMADGYDNFRILETAPEENGSEEQHYYMPKKAE